MQFLFSQIYSLERTLLDFSDTGESELKSMDINNTCITKDACEWIYSYATDHDFWHNFTDGLRNVLLLKLLL